MEIKIYLSTGQTLDFSQQTEKIVTESNLMPQVLQAAKVFPLDNFCYCTFLLMIVSILLESFPLEKERIRTFSNMIKVNAKL